MTDAVGGGAGEGGGEHGGEGEEFGEVHGGGDDDGWGVVFDVNGVVWCGVVDGEGEGRRVGWK